MCGTYARTILNASRESKGNFDLFLNRLNIFYRAEIFSLAKNWNEAHWNDGDYYNEWIVSTAYALLWNNKINYETVDCLLHSINIDPI